MSSLYIYYRVRPEAQAELLPMLRDLQQAISADFGVAAQLMRKCGGDPTLMEVYQGVGDADRLLAALDERFRGLGLDRLIAADGRHVEHFECA